MSAASESLVYRLLSLLFSLSAVGPQSAVSLSTISRHLSMPVEALREILMQLRAQGYANVTDDNRAYLTESGVLKLISKYC